MSNKEFNESWQTHHIVTSNNKSTGVGKLLRANRGFQVPMLGINHRELHNKLYEYYNEQNHNFDIAYGQQPLGGPMIRKELISNVEEFRDTKAIDNLDLCLSGLEKNIAMNKKVMQDIRTEAGLVIGGLLIQRDCIIDGVYRL